MLETMQCKFCINGSISYADDESEDGDRLGEEDYPDTASDESTGDNAEQGNPQAASSSFSDHSVADVLNCPILDT